jgi:hypothetical protein
MPPLVSIISPVYNQQRYVAQCIDSALAQTYPHRGLGARAESYNAALAVASGSLVAILEGDDAWPADKLERQVPLFDDPRTVLSWGRGALIDADGRPTRVMTTMKSTGPRADVDMAAAFHRLTRENFFIPSVAVMVRRAALDAVGGFRQTGSQLFVDLPTWLWVAATAEGHATYLDEVLGIYRHHAAGTSTEKAAQMKLEHLRVALAIEEALGPDALARVRWDARSRRRAMARGGLVKGKLDLAAGRYADASASYAEAFTNGGGLGVRIRALRGMISARLRAAIDGRARS